MCSDYTYFSDIMKKLDEVEEKQLRSNYLRKIGLVIRQKREQKNITQESLAECLHIDRTTLSRYETGATDMNASVLPVVSTYCKFSMADYFDPDIDQMINTFSELVEITRQRYVRKAKREQRKAANYDTYGSTRRLKAYIYEENGHEVIHYVGEKLKPESLRKRYFRAEVELPDTAFSYAEFREYFVREYNSNDLLYLDAAHKLLQFLGQTEKRETFKCNLAEFVIMEMIVKRIMDDPTEFHRRAYGYYQELLNQ